MTPIIDKVFVAIAAVVIAAAGAVLVLQGAGWIDASAWMLSLFHSPFDAFLVAILLLLLAGYLFYALVRPDIRQAVVHATELGEIRIGLNTIRSLVSRAARQVDGVRDALIALDQSEQLQLRLRITVYPDYSIPELTERVQTSVQSYLQHTVGITPQRVQVLVQGISGENRTQLK